MRGSCSCSQTTRLQTRGGQAEVWHIPRHERSAGGRFFVFFNDLLSSGEITDLYPSEDCKADMHYSSMLAHGMPVNAMPRMLFLYQDKDSIRNAVRRHDLISDSLHARHESLENKCKCLRSAAKGQGIVDTPDNLQLGHNRLPTGPAE